MVLNSNIHKNHKALRQWEGGEWDMEVGEQGDYVPITTLSLLLCLVLNNEDIFKCLLNG